ncbi:hypothetical protein SOVF_108500, partial [Spinacia oleracea]
CPALCLAESPSLPHRPCPPSRPTLRLTSPHTTTPTLRLVGSHTVHRHRAQLCDAYSTARL